MSERYLALVLHAPTDLRLDEREVGPIGPGQVMVRVGMGGICGSDLHYFHHGGFGAIRVKEPMALGHEVAGTVSAVAADVTTLKVGDRVAVNPSLPCGRCQYCLEGLPNQCTDMRYFGSAMRTPHVQGAFRNLLVCEAIQCEPIGADTPMALASLAEPFAVGLHAVSRAGSLLGKRVLVSGCGPIGAMVVAAARLHGAAEIIATDVVDAPLKVVRAMGADKTHNVASEPDWTQPYARNKGQIDVMFECSGNERALRSGLDAMRPRGVVVQLGLGGDVSVPQNVIVAKELLMMGSFRFHAEFALAVRLINDKRVDLAPVITRAFGMKHAVEAFELASDRQRAMKVLIDFGSDV
ncbi:L-idonate 5-dehydrogenase [Rhodoferax koreense]|uniref:L-idonate 5-dehydrogenase n=1 Tax=Rhodoferax koreensis TaxID=1842727 RepID=A0A1P8K0Z3_9BURK|nr:L-idonate 5-dehydrogenase [Rhodoferax koreense]APW39684.1 L-idonate 5-dehydrogenase [Rhodoferax koreense]